MLASGQLDLPPPGAGGTLGRLTALHEFGRRDLSIARLAEAHCDAAAILAEAGRAPHPASLYGVWASDGPSSQLLVKRAGRKVLLTGRKLYCSGACITDRALVTAHEGGGVQLFDISPKAPGISMRSSGWVTPAFAATCTWQVEFDEVEVEACDRVGAGNWYLERVGFWHGALGPAACWAGGAAGLIAAALALPARDPHTRAQFGALEAARWSMQAALNQASLEIDSQPDALGPARQRAYVVRHLIERTCTEVLDRFGRATGPQLLAFDAGIARRYAELTLYIRQCHAERDLEKILSHSAADSGIRPLSRHGAEGSRHAGSPR
jgi:hypothetical protein